MNKKFQNKYGSWALITGASDGIGKEVAIEIAKKGLNVILVARRKEILHEVEREIYQYSSVKVKIISLDLSKTNALETLVENIKEMDIGLFAAIAGFGTSGEFIQSNISTELNMIDVNCRAVVEQTHYFAKAFLQKKRGGIILMGSLVGFQGSPFATNYSATKAFIQTFAEGLYFELKPYGIDILCVAPGPVSSGFANRAHMNMGNSANPKQVAKKILPALGCQVTVRPGFLSKFLGWSLIILPRIIRIKIMKIIMKNMAISLIK